MSAEQIQDVKDILQSVAAIKGCEFVETVLLAAQVQSLHGMILSTEMDEDRKSKILTAAIATHGCMLAAITNANKFDSAEIMQWTDRITNRIHNIED